MLALSACYSPEEIEAVHQQNDRSNEASFKNPEQVGVLPDGRKVHMVSVRYSKQGSGYVNEHYIYFVDNNISDNYSIQSGKTRTEVVDVFLPENPTNDQIIAAAEKIKQEKQAKRKELYEQLKNEFENKNSDQK